MTTGEILKAARDLIADETRWTRGAFARDAKGHGLINAKSAGAVCWCAEGAIRKVGGLEATPAVNVLGRLTGGWLVDFNDGNSDLPYDRAPRRAPARHRKVLAAFDKAIAECDE